MLFLLFQIGQDRYALDARQIVEVLPLVSITPLPQAPIGVAGVFMYRGVPVPVIDVNQLTMGSPSHSRLNTRLVVVHFPDSEGQTRLVGLIAERATETMRREASDFAASGVENDQAPYLGPVTTDASGLVQRMDVEKLLPPAVRRMLFTASASS
jgi:chemotaxis-related protein WspB